MPICHLDMMQPFKLLSHDAMEKDTRWMLKCLCRLLLPVQDGGSTQTTILQQTYHLWPSARVLRAPEAYLFHYTTIMMSYYAFQTNKLAKNNSESQARLPSITKTVMPILIILCSTHNCDCEINRKDWACVCAWTICFFPRQSKKRRIGSKTRGRDRDKDDRQQKTDDRQKRKRDTKAFPFFSCLFALEFQ